MSFSPVKLGRFLRHRSEFIEINDERSYKRLRVQLHGRGIMLRDEVEGIEVKTKKQQVVRKGDFVVAEIDAKLGGFGLVGQDLDGGIVSSHYFIFDVDESVCLRGWLDAVIRAGHLEEQVLARGSTNYAAIRPAHVLEFEILLPPLPEQRRIVARIKQISARLEEAKLLDADCTREVEALQKAALASTERALSERFGTQPLRELIRQAGYGTSVKCSPEREPAAIPVLRIPNIAAERVNLGDMKYGSLTTEELQRFAVVEGDLLVVRTNGSLDLVGRCAVVPALAEPTAYASYLIKLRVDRSLVDPHFLQLMLKHLRSQGELVALARTTAGQYNVSLGRLESARIPLPELPQQHQVVQYHSSLRSRIEGLRNLKRDIAAEMEATTSASLSKAFSGEI